MDPFATLGVEPRFDLDPAELERRHRELSRALHPDRHAAEPPAQRRLALSRAIEVNEAYRMLKDPIRRAERVLEARGVPIGEGKEPPASGALLMEMMESRETLADAVRAKDAATVARLGDEMRDRERGLLTKLAAALATVSPETSQQAMVLLGELRYTRRFLDEVSAFEEVLAG
ncbi:MAG: Fe-S protein assembly co-chaperone HscB [Polyangiaceae bacterium]|nr:Fe-S protein assembly co-chaperone HscB [Polyangiaceae bacterium]